MQIRVSARSIRHRAALIKKAARHMSRAQTCKTFGIVTPDGSVNKKAVTLILEGYIPAHEDTLRRWGLLGDPLPVVIAEEPTRRVLTGSWNLGGCWVNPEEFFGARS
jgi:hypothetical protein